MKLYREGSRSVQSAGRSMIWVKGLKGAFRGELVSVEAPDGVRRGEVVRLEDDSCGVHVYEGVLGLRCDAATVWLEGRSAGSPSGERFLGSVVDGYGGSDETAFLDRCLSPIRPLPPLAERRLPSLPFETGCSVVDLFFPLFLGQSMGLSVPMGSSGDEFLLRLLNDLRVAHKKAPPLTVVAAIGRSRNEAVRLTSVLHEGTDFEDAILVLSREIASASERFATLETAFAVAEHFAFALGRDVVLAATDMDAHEAARKERAEERGEGEDPEEARRALARLFGRCGCRSGVEGSLTFLPLFFRARAGESSLLRVARTLMEGCWVLDSDGRGARFPVNVRESSSFLLSRTGRGTTFAGHQFIADQIKAAYLKLDAEGVFLPSDGEFGARFEKDFLRQRWRRLIAQTEAAAWRLMADLPPEELFFLPEQLRRKADLVRDNSKGDVGF